MTGLLAGRVAIVTGSGQGIGSAIARRLAAEGASVIVNSRSASSADQTPTAADCAADISAAGGSAHPVFADAGTEAGAQTLVDTAIAQFGRLDILVNNAGITPSMPLQDMELCDWNAVLSTNLTAVYLTCRAALPHLRAARNGRVINMTSRFGLAGHQNHTAYAASKAGVIGFTYALAKEVRGSGVTVNCIAPTAATVRTTRSAARRYGVPADTLRKPEGLTPEHVAPLVVYLLTDRAAGYNGQVFGAVGSEIVRWAPPQPVMSIKTSGIWQVDELAARLSAAFGDRLEPPPDAARIWDTA